MVRKIIKIDQEKCSGCGLCADACHEGAIGMVDGKAVLLREDYCDGLGDCLPACPTGAITFEEREAPAYDAAAVAAAQSARSARSARSAQSAQSAQSAKAEAPAESAEPLPCGCPGTHSKTIHRPAQQDDLPQSAAVQSQLAQWPVQIKLVPVNAPYFNGANLLVAADCSAYAYGDFHTRFMKNRVTLIGCPKLDAVDYAEKLTEILSRNEIKSVTVLRMEVPCCGGIEHAVQTALQKSGKWIPWQVHVISTDGRALED